MLSTAQVNGSIGEQNRRTRQPIPESLRRNPPLYIFNVWEDKQVRYLGSLGTFHIPGCPAGQEYSIPVVIKGDYFDEFDQGDGKLGWTYNSGEEVAADILNMRNPEADLSRWGLFVSQHEKPKAREIEAAKEKLKGRMQEILAAGDALALQGDSGLAQIQAMHRRAAQYLKQSRDWTSDQTQAMRDCHGCGAFVKEKLPRCPECKAAFDIVKCREIWPLEYPVVNAAR